MPLDDPLVVADDRLEIVAKGHGRRDMDGVERPEHAWLERAGSIEDSIVDSDEIDPPKAVPNLGQGLPTEVADGA